MATRPVEIVSGGQTGVDRAALDTALALGLTCGGWCPRGRRAEDGPLPARYPLRETPSASYPERTEWNVRDSDGTLVLHHGRLRGGTALTNRPDRAPGAEARPTGAPGRPPGGPERARGAGMDLPGAHPQAERGGPAGGGASPHPGPGRSVPSRGPLFGARAGGAGTLEG